ncbi:hypothetical protein BDZ97DRAFT_1923502 [Flammula alnicola]|nr:hypothetical protein BDZ97DRAFT_1923502 [Flammula alnicola]
MYHEQLVNDVRAAIDDVLHPIRETSDYVMVFGTRLHREFSGFPLPFHGWGHMTAVYPCYSCVRRVCKTVDDTGIVALTRYAILTGSGLAQSQIKYERNADTRSGLKKASWDPTEATYFKDRILEEARPLTSLDHQLDDCFQVAIINGGELRRRGA